ncbi:hypothetical protein [Acinetobacter soli]|uniref:hypothetical protein n=1 Tax=Acinetobacter soli TaxID=487316 RepID=UPI00125EA715|nr:hypothetical protein [Acinetobacter soli]
MNDFVYPKYKTPSIDDPAVIELAKTINEEQILSIPFEKKLLPLGNCYWNVEHVVKSHGGEVQYGWIFNLWENILVEAMHHAVWKSPGGKLIDVTENYPMFSNTHIIFLPDNSSALNNLDVVPTIQNHFLRLSNDLNAQNFITANRNKIDLLKHYQNALYNAGYRCEQHREIASGVQSSPPKMNYNQLSATDIKALKEIPQMIQTIEAHLAAYISYLNQLD